jgi:hypothetical protein
MREARFATDQARATGRKLEAVPPAEPPAAEPSPRKKPKQKIASRPRGKAKKSGG